MKKDEKEVRKKVREVEAKIFIGALQLEEEI